MSAPEYLPNREGLNLPGCPEPEGAGSQGKHRLWPRETWSPPWSLLQPRATGRLVFVRENVFVTQKVAVSAGCVSANVPGAPCWAGSILTLSPA